MRFNFANLWAKLENVKARYLPVGGPATLDGVIALRVAPTATSTTDNEQAPFKAISDADESAPAGELLGVTARLQGFDTIGFEPLRTQSTQTAGNVDGAQGVLAVAEKTNWSVVANPVAGIQAAAGKAPPGVGSRHVITGLMASLDDDGTGVVAERIELLDGDSVLYAVTHMALPAGSGNPCDRFELTGLHIVLPENQQVVWRFANAPPGTARQSVTLIGYSTSGV